MDPSPGYGTRLTRLERDLAAVTERLRALEAAAASQLQTPTAESAPAALPTAAPPPDHPAGANDMAGMATLLGRSFIVFGGAYLLRALTESGRLPNAAGILIGLTYALFWMAAAWRDAPVRRTSAQFYAITALLIGLPIVWEATTRFALLEPGLAAAAFGAIGLLALVTSRRGRLHAVAGVAGFGTLAAAFATAWATNHHGAFSLLLIGLGTATYWLAEEPARGWLRWPAAIASGLSVLAVTMRAIATPPLEPAWLALLTHATLLATMQGSLAVRVLMLGRNMRTFDILQAASSLVIGVGGAVLVSRRSPAGPGLVGALTALLAIGAYLAAFMRLSDRPHLARSYHTFAALGLMAGVTALVLLMSGAVLATAALLLSLAMIAIGPRWLAGYAPLHAAAYVITALAASGVLSLSLTAWTELSSPWPTVTGLAWLSLAATAMCVTLRPPPPGEMGDLLARTGRFIAAFAFAFGAGGLLVIILAPLIAGSPIDAGVLASLRTAVLSIAVIGLGASVRWPAVAAFSRLVYPVLVLGGVRLLLDDFRHSRPSTLFIALALYGMAWALGPRLAARGTARGGRP